MTPEEIHFTRQLADEILEAHAQDRLLDPQLALDLAYRVLIMADGYLQMYQGTVPTFPPTLKIDDVNLVIDQIIAIETHFHTEPLSDICACIRLNQDIDYYVPLKYRPALERLLARGLDIASLLPDENSTRS